MLTLPAQHLATDLAGTDVTDRGTAPAPLVVLAIAGALILALVVAEVLAAVVRAVGRRTWLAENLSRRARRPLRAVLVVAFVWLALRFVTDPPPDGPAWRPTVEHVLLIALIVGAAWLIGALAFVVEDAATARYRLDVPDNRHARRVRTQIMILRRLTVAVLVVCAVAGVLLTFEGARAAGAGLLASAGLLSVVAGLAAQTSLANVFAGLQLAFTDAIRVDDVVVVEGQWGRIEEITMTYVVVHVWDDRRLILPSTFFTTTPFENWTRRAADLLGTVELDLDWDVPVAEMRAELTRLLNESGLWDHRVGILQVTEAVGGFVRVRALASAADAPTLFDLRCEVREGLVEWLRSHHPEALPRSRWEQSGPVGDERPVRRVPRREQPVADGGSASPVRPGRPSDGAAEGAGPATAPLPAGSPDAHPTADDTVRLDPKKDSRLFTGSLPAIERSKAFAGPGIDVIAEREQTASGAVPAVPADGDDDARPDRPGPASPDRP
ncbi:mechanosensitive ion channel [Actinotalea ferrariae]|nr:mechanosensitive ion channel [Actinotalea ferrariae]